MIWPIVYVRSTPKRNLSYLDQSDWVQSMMKIKNKNDLTNHKGVVYAENEIKLSWSIRLGEVYD